MSFKKIKEGSYRAKAVEGVFGRVGQNQTSCVKVRFDFMSEGTRESIWHTMYLTHTALKDGSTVAEKTFNTLVGILGFNETKELLKTPEGNPYFDQTYLADKQVEIVIADEQDKNDPAKSYTKVKYVNELRGTRMSGSSLAEILGNQDIKALCAAARARLGVTSQGPVAPTAPSKDFDLF